MLYVYVIRFDVMENFQKNLSTKKTKNKKKIMERSARPFLLPSGEDNHHLFGCSCLSRQCKPNPTSDRPVRAGMRTPHRHVLVKSVKI